MDGLIVRAAEPGDVKVLASLIEEIERFYGAAEVQPFEERVAQVEQAVFGTPPLANVILAEADGEIVGMAAYSFLWPAAGSTHSLFLKELYVRAHGRRRGVGTRLMEEIRTIAEARPGCSRVEWMTDRDNDVSIAFYRSLGFDEYRGKIVYRFALG